MRSTRLLGKNILKKSKIIPEYFFFSSDSKQYPDKDFALREKNTLYHQSLSIQNLSSESQYLVFSIH